MKTFIFIFALCSFTFICHATEVDESINKVTDEVTKDGQSSNPEIDPIQDPTINNMPPSDDYYSEDEPPSNQEGSSFYYDPQENRSGFTQE